MMGSENDTVIKHEPRFCVLEYRPQMPHAGSDWTGSIVLLAVRDENGILHFSVRPDWQPGILDEDRDYLDALLADFLERAQLDPEALFQQLCALGVGPLITREVGAQLADRPDLLALAASFKHLSPHGKRAC